MPAPALKAPPKAPPVVDLHEVQLNPDGGDFLTLREAKVLDEKSRTVEVTLVTVGPGNKVDKNYYTQAAIDSAPPLFEGCVAMADHPSKFDASVQPERRSRDIIGWYTGVTVLGEAVKATLHILNSSDKDWAWDLVKECIRYASEFPGRNLAGLSINARGNFKPMTLEGEQWKGVTQFVDVKSVDLVTKPARGGQFETVISESEMEHLVGGNTDNEVNDNVRHLTRSGYGPEQALALALKKAGRTTTKTTEAEGEQAAKIFQAVKNQVRALCANGTAPGMEDLRRMTDKLGTALGFNKQEDDSMDPNQLQPGQEPGADISDDEMKKTALGAAAEKLRAQAEAETDPGKKAQYAKMADRYAKMAEGGEGALNITHGDPAKTAQAAPQADAEAARKQAEADAESKKQAEAKQSDREKYVDLLTTTLLKESGLPAAKVNYLKTVVLEGEKDETKIRAKVSAYLQAELQESNKGGHGFARPSLDPDAPAPASKGGELRDSAKGIKRLLSATKGV